MWAAIRGMRKADEIISALEAVGITSYSKFTGFMLNTTHKDDRTDELESVCKEYKSKSGWAQSRFKKKNATIEGYEEAVKYIKEHSKPDYVDGKPLTMLDLMEKSNNLRAK